jgi:glycosyltransferase involved in cell wall biosynthesis
MRILVVTVVSMDRSEAAICLGLRRAGFEMELACPPTEPRQDQFREAGIEISPIRIRHRLDLPAAALLRRKLGRGGYDLVYAPINKSLSVSLIATRGLRVPVVGYRGTTGHLSRLDPASWLTYLHPRLSRIVCVSEAVRQYLLGMGLPPERLITIYKGHDLAWYASLQKPNLRDLGVPDGVVTVCFAGRARPVKGVDVLLDALARLPPSPPVHLLLVGEIQDAAIRRQAADPRIRDRVHLLGFRRDAPAVAGACDLLVMPSVAREGLPRAVIEGMAQGIPAVVSGVGGLPELVVNGESGLVVPPRNVEALAAAIARFAADPALRRRCGENARDRIRTRFNIDTTIAEYVKLFTAVAGRSAANGTG